MAAITFSCLMLVVTPMLLLIRLCHHGSSARLRLKLRIRLCNDGCDNTHFLEGSGKLFESAILLWLLFSFAWAAL